MATNDETERENKETMSSVLASLATQLGASNSQLTQQVTALGESTRSGFASVGSGLASVGSKAVNGSAAGLALNALNPGSAGGVGSFLSSLVLGPVWRGLFSLFGSNEEKAQPVLTPYTSPAAALTQIDARLGPDGQGAALRTDGQGVTRSQPDTAPAVNITIQALDARSIIDRSDEIASAVRLAMLSNHAINESLTEL